MTAQINDTFRHAQEDWNIAASTGGAIFEPGWFGMAPMMIHTACYRGWYARYAIADNHLVLDQLTVNLPDQAYPDINGVSPAPAADRRERTYESVGLPLSYTGTLVLGRDFIRRMYVHMGYQRPFTYERVLAFNFQAGVPTVTRDLSAQMQALREQGATQEPARNETLAAWIERMFSSDVEDV